MRLFGSKEKKKKEEKTSAFADPKEGMARLYTEMVAKIEAEYTKFVVEHLERVHEPGGYEREKKESDFMDLGMGRGYMQALDNMEFSPLETFVAPQLKGRKRGMATVVTRWTVRGVHARPLAGVPPSGNEVTIEGETHTTLRDYKVRIDSTYWEFPELTRTVIE
jgi:hypothetical protein